MLSNNIFFILKIMKNYFFDDFLIYFSEMYIIYSILYISLKSFIAFLNVFGPKLPFTTRNARNNTTLIICVKEKRKKCTRIT